MIQLYNENLEDAIAACMENGISTIASCAEHKIWDSSYIAMKKREDVIGNAVMIKSSFNENKIIETMDCINTKVKEMFKSNINNSDGNIKQENEEGFDERIKVDINPQPQNHNNFANKDNKEIRREQ